VPPAQKLLNILIVAATCVQCRAGTADVGLICSTCADKLAGCAGLLPDHISSKIEPARADAWLIDPWGHPHAVSGEKTLVGRMPGHDLLILNASVSRDHAELRRDDEAWVVRDLGSRNWTQVDGSRVQGRAQFGDGARISFGDAAFYFRESDDSITAMTQRPAATGHAMDSRTFRYTLRGESNGTELCLIGTRSDETALESGGALLYREQGEETWEELSLAALEFQLLNMLCRQWLEEEGSPSKTRGCVATKRLAKLLPFQSKYANEENVRQVVRRLRATLKKIGVEDLIGAVPGRGYHLAWPVCSA